MPLDKLLVGHAAILSWVTTQFHCHLCLTCDRLTLYMCFKPPHQGLEVMTITTQNYCVLYVRLKCTKVLYVCHFT